MAALLDLITVQQFRQMPDDGNAYLHHGEVVAVTRPKARYDQIDPDDNLHGAPELVVEIKSPSNTNRKLRELASLALANGCWECWIVEADRASLTVIRRDGSSSLFDSSRSLPLLAFAGAELSVEEIFH
jgi:Uma2 family endonuclease